MVVGAGAIGLATASELARAGYAVTVLDAGGNRLGASDISFAWLNASGKTRRDYFELNAAGMAAFRRRWTRTIRSSRRPFECAVRT